MKILIFRSRRSSKIIDAGKNAIFRFRNRLDFSTRTHTKTKLIITETIGGFFKIFGAGPYPALRDQDRPAVSPFF
jgi:hypothetical protein